MGKKKPSGDQGTGQSPASDQGQSGLNQQRYSSRRANKGAKAGKKK